MITTRKSVFSHYKSLENGIKARGFLVGMLEEAKPSMYKHGFELLDPAAVVSFGNVITLKTPQGEYTHAVCVTLDTAEEKYNKVWLRYKSEENAQKGRRALYAVLHSLKSQGSIEVKAEAAEALAKAA
jgi:hypothetical protein